jgi:NADPH:quinone reductase-like Zn-dependent oxidoreductase
MMRAAWFESFGPAAEVLTVGEIETPAAGPGEVLVKLATSGVNPSDVKKRAGSFPNLLDEGLVIPNSDGAGVIEAVGEGVDSKRVGERVWVYQAQFARRFGTAADYVAIDSERAPRLPAETDFTVGACLGIPVMTAHRVVFADGDVAGQTVLITGGAGRVGYYAIQWASQAGATVIATASNEVDAQTCRAGGAAHVVNHRDEQLSAAILDASGGRLIDRVVDLEFGANVQTSVEVLRVGGIIATYGSVQEPRPTLPFFNMMYKDLTVHFVIVYAMPEAAKMHAIADIDRALTHETLDHRIAYALPLDEIAKANEIIEEGTCRGAVVLTLS